MNKQAIVSALETNHCFVVSEGTFDTHDLFVAYSDVLAVLDPAAHQQLMMPQGTTPEYIRALGEGSDADFWATEEADFIVSDLADCLCAAAPDGFYFGAHEGDGACLGFWETDERREEREFAEFVQELADVAEGPLAGRGSYLRLPRKVHLAHETSSNGVVGPDCRLFTVFAFGAYGSTFIAVPSDGDDIGGALESAAATLYAVAPGLFITPDYDAARAEMLDDGSLTAEEHGDRDSDEVTDRIARRAETDLTYTESGWLASWEWSIAGTFTREELLTFARGE